jgi:hypothetical protein
MSHKATVWAIQQRGLKPATKIVLWFLCDRHNPDFGCFPTQARLADDAEMSISALNEHLARLQELRLIHRVRAQDPHTHKRLATRYILGFEDGFPPEPTPETGDGFAGTESEQDSDPTPDSGHGAISGFSEKPSPDFAQSHLRNPEINLVREPLSKPVKEEEDAQAHDIDFDRFFAELLTALGLDAAALPGWWQGGPPRLHVQRWREKLGLSQDEIVAVAVASRSEHPEPPDGPKALDRAMQRAVQRKTQGRAEKHRKAKPEATKPATIIDLAVYYADFLNSGRYVSPSSIKNTLRDEMLGRGLVTPELLRQRGVR